MTDSNPAAPADARPVVVFDGECPFCIRQIERMQGRDEEGRFDYAPRQTEGLEQQHPGLAEGDFDTGLRLVRRDGQIRVGADAIYEIARELRGWRHLAWLYRVAPLRPLFRAAYGYLARRRKKLKA